VALNLAAAEPLEINSGNPSNQTIEDATSAMIEGKKLASGQCN
jgi:hypothetical protein